MTKVMARWAGAVGVAAVLVTGCSGRADDEDASGGGSTRDGTEHLALDADEAAEPSPGDGSGAGGDTALAVDTVVADRQVVRTGSMRITVDDADDAADEVRALATDADGFVADEQVRAEDDTVDITVRVPVDAFDDVRAGVGDLGDVTEQDVQARDVTAEVVDLDSRIASLQASVERVRALLGEAGDVAQLALVEGELASRETELESLLGQQRVLEDQVALATLTVHLGEDGSPAPAEDAAGFGDGLRRGWVALVDGGRLTLAVVGFLLPFAVPAGLVIAGLRWWMRRRPTAEPATEARP